MKRHDTLIPLSHDHHHALVVALRLKKGGPASQHDNWPANPEAQRTALLEFADRELLPHFAVEEEVLFPACFNSTEEIRSVAEALRRDHTEMRRLLKEISIASPTNLLQIMSEFGVMLEAHIRKEERSFFPLVEQGISEDTLQVDGIALRQQYDLYHTPPTCDT